MLSLGDIRNVEQACENISYASRTLLRSRLTPSEREDLLAYLISEAWVLWRRYDPHRGAKFSTFAYPQLRMRVIDWQRRRLGRGAGPGEWGVSSLDRLLDDPVNGASDCGGVDDGDGPESRLGWALATAERDDPAARYADLDGLFAAGGRGARGPFDA